LIPAGQDANKERLVDTGADTNTTDKNVVGMTIFLMI